MALLPILEYPDPRLRKVAAPVTAFTPEVVKLVRDMADTMYAAPGVGLAATQVDVHKRIIVIDISDTKDDLLVLVNPEIVAAEGRGGVRGGLPLGPGVLRQRHPGGQDHGPGAQRARRTDRADRGRPPRRLYPARNGPPRRQDVRRLSVAAQTRSSRRQAAQETADGGLTARRAAAASRSDAATTARRLCRDARRSPRRRSPRSCRGGLCGAGGADPARPPARTGLGADGLGGQGAGAGRTRCRACSRRRSSRRRPAHAASRHRRRRPGRGRVWADPAACRPRPGPASACVNIHASLLPRWRGAAPIQRAIAAGDATHRRHHHADGCGPRYRADDRDRRVPIAPRETAGTLQVKLATTGADAIVRVLQRFAPRASASSLTAAAPRGSPMPASSSAPTPSLDWTLPAVARRPRDSRLRSRARRVDAASERRSSRCGRRIRCRPLPHAPPGTVLAVGGRVSTSPAATACSGWSPCSRRAASG